MRVSRRNGIWKRQNSAPRDVEAVLASDSYPFFLDAMYGDMPNNWSPELSGLARLRFISKCLYPYALLFPERAAGYVCQKKRRKTPLRR
ncbi:Bis(5'-nucleosyl)-tetraphosphatase [symmetrical] [Raoultella planticola]|uniref:Bis(5'-nucleosyl)-tetraphosphatase [symmetrical] n=1 Tax=Raoultella planticola TaxID=575 RepID=A0A485AZK2_RAOPL|nr:Bis(5'-nucleosyl)-tetraphosphatase [symmetrical] [Raoultella planticola]